MVASRTVNIDVVVIKMVVVDVVLRSLVEVRVIATDVDVHALKVQLLI